MCPIKFARFLIVLRTEIIYRKLLPHSAKKWQQFNPPRSTLFQVVMAPLGFISGRYSANRHSVFGLNAQCPRAQISSSPWLSCSKLNPIPIFYCFVCNESQPQCMKSHFVIYIWNLVLLIYTATQYYTFYYSTLFTPIKSSRKFPNSLGSPGGNLLRDERSFCSSTSFKSSQMQYTKCSSIANCFASSN